MHFILSAISFTAVAKDVKHLSNFVGEKGKNASPVSIYRFAIAEPQRVPARGNKVTESLGERATRTPASSAAKHSAGTETVKQRNVTPRDP